MRYKVPQNIDMQDRILGPLTMIQLGYAILGGGLAYSAVMALPKPLSYIVAGPIGLLTVTLIFVKVNERPFLNFLMSFIAYLSAPRQRVWHHQASGNFNVVIVKDPKKEKSLPTKNISHEKIHQVAGRLDA